MRNISLLIGLCFSLCLAAQNATDVMQQQQLLIGSKAAPLKLTDWLKNTPADTSFKGKFKVLEFWATWCRPCLAAVPHLNKLQDKFQHENIVFLSIGYESPEKVASTLKKVDFQTIVVSDQTRTIHQDLRVSYEGTMPLPRTVLIDDQDNIIWYGTPKKLTEKMLRKFLNREKIH